MYLFLNAVVQEKKSWRESKETLDPSESLESCPMSLLQANPQGRKRMWRWTTEAPERERGPVSPCSGMVRGSDRPPESSTASMLCQQEKSLAWV